MKPRVAKEPDDSVCTLCTSRAGKMCSSITTTTPAPAERADAATRAAAIITPSASAKADLVRIYGVDAARVHVVHEAAAPEFQPFVTGEPSKCA